MTEKDKLFRLGLRVKEVDMTDKMTFFQFQPELDLPIYLRLDLDAFHSEMEDFLNVRGFIKISKDDAASVAKDMEKTLYGRVLTIKPAVPSVAKQITGIIESDQFGEESIVPKTGYRVYRFKNHGLLIYSFAASEWELGCFESFGSKNNQMESISIINRFLSWSLSSHGMIGFWGKFDQGQLTVQKKSDSNGETVYLDVRNRKVIDRNGVHKLDGTFSFIRLNNSIKRTTQMSPETLLGFLSSRCTYLDPQGLSVPVRQMLQRIAQEYLGFEATISDVSLANSEA